MSCPHIHSSFSASSCSLGILRCSQAIWDCTVSRGSFRSTPAVLALVLYPLDHQRKKLRRHLGRLCETPQRLSPSDGEEQQLCYAPWRFLTLPSYLYCLAWPPVDELPTFHWLVSWPHSSRGFLPLVGPGLSSEVLPWASFSLQPTWSCLHYSAANLHEEDLEASLFRGVTSSAVHCFYFGTVALLDLAEPILTSSACRLSLQTWSSVVCAVHFLGKKLLCVALPWGKDLRWSAKTFIILHHCIIFTGDSRVALSVDLASALHHNWLGQS